MLGNKKIIYLLLGVLSLVIVSTPLFADGEEINPYRPKDATKVKHSNKAFRPDPTYEDKPYSAEKQLFIYGGKTPFREPRPLLELNRPLYPYGSFPKTGVWDGEGWPTVDQALSMFWGAKNPSMFHILVFGDFKTAIAYNDNGKNDQAVLAWQLNLNIDVQLTSTERIHIFMQPLQQGGDFTRWDFGGENHNFEERIDFNVENLFFEGDLGVMIQGWTGNETGFSMPIGVGLINLLFHNGVWFNEAFTGAALTIPALNVPALDISNMDITFFAGFDRIDTFAIAADEDADIFGVNIFIETMKGYWEIGYGYTRDSSEDGDGNGNFADYHNIIVSFSKRYGGILSNSIRVIWNFGQDSEFNGDGTADGVLLLIENSIISPLPSTLVPYFNLFAGFDRPQSLANNNGNLFQTGINFETDGLTGFPKLDDTGQDTYGFALGIEYLFALDKQIVFEFATVQELEGAQRAANANNGGLAFQGEQYAFQMRFQLPVNWGTTWNATIFRVDAMYAILPEDDDLSGIRLEVRQKF